jgi:hypothetical protein
LPGYKIEERPALQSLTPKTTLDIFKGTWISALPGEFARYESRIIPLFNDVRIPVGIKFKGIIKGINIVDLSRFEVSRTYTPR